MTTRDPMTPPPFDCAAVDARLADYLDDGPPGALAPGERAAVDEHVAGCARCRALVRDLGALTAHAAALPTFGPPRDLWPGIAARLTDRAPAAGPSTADAPARVIPIEVHRLRYALPAVTPRGGAIAGRGATLTWGRRRLAAAAVALMAVSAGGTYLLTRAMDGANRPAGAASALAASDPARPAAAPARDPGAAPGGAAAVGRAVASAAAREGAAPNDDRLAGGAPDGEPVEAPRAGERGGRPTRAGQARLVRRAESGPDAALPAAAAYDREIAALRAAVRERRGELDSATVAVLVRNLGIIDAAIAQSRAALARDPHSPLLGDQLTRALGQKVELLRTVALMPRT